MGAALDAAKGGADACLGTLRLALYLSLDELVREVVGAIGDALDVHNATSLLTLANALDCAPLRERVSGFVVTHIAQVAESDHWRDSVPPAEQQRLLTLAAAAHANPIGSSLGSDAMHDVHELVAVADEILLAQRERFEEAAAALERERPGESADYAARKLDGQRDRITLLEAYVKRQRVSLESSASAPCKI